MVLGDPCERVMPTQHGVMTHWLRTTDILEKDMNLTYVSFIIYSDAYVGGSHHH